MSEHAIRLRGAWQYRPLTDSQTPPRRVDLPTHWTDEIEERLLLTRRFQAPAIETTKERLSIRFANVPGLLSIQLNEQDITPETLPSASEAFDVPVRLLAGSTNLLVLEVDLQGQRSHQESDSGETRDAWGVIALIIQPWLT